MCLPYSCKLRTECNGGPGVELSLTILNDLSHHCGLDVLSGSCPLLAILPHTLSSVSHMMKFLTVLSTSRPCIGNSDQRFLELVSVKPSGFKDVEGTMYIFITCFCTCTM